jgi:hypothetical protein
VNAKASPDAGKSYRVLQQLTPAQRAIFAKYDKPGSIPFLDFAGRVALPHHRRPPHRGLPGIPQERRVSLLTAVGVLAIPQDDPEKEAAVWEYLAELAMQRAITTPVGPVRDFEDVPRMIAGQSRSRARQDDSPGVRQGTGLVSVVSDPAKGKT